ncbi:MAG: VOC family protein [Candidatus Riflebacteria bacterium]|nr:VOC family protein [Candidatus Riflebacteria bacterium]
MILGLRTACYPVTDMAIGRAWYSKVLGVEPYFDEPFYVGFNVGGFELGLIPDGTPGSGGVGVFWGVLDAALALERLAGLGAIVHEPLKEVGGGIKVGSVKDPFGNVFGVIENPQFDPKSVR